MSSETDPQVHATAVVEKGASLGSGSRVWHHCHIRTGARIGRDCILGKNVFIDADVSIGNGVKIQNNVSVYKGVDVGDEVFIGPSVVFTNDRYPRASASEWEIVTTSVENGASIGANATIVAGVTIAASAMVAAGAVVTRSTEENELVAGNPARRIGWICDCTKTINRTSGTRGKTLCDSCNVQV